MWDPWHAQTIRIWVPLYRYVTPDIVFPFGPGPVVETHGRFGEDPLPPNFSSAAIPGLIAGCSSGNASSFDWSIVFIPLVSGSVCIDDPSSLAFLPSPFALSNGFDVFTGTAATIIL
ncbi:hypothetical protein Hanom_Chr09g00759711 [Helianthus anomalus]